MHPQRHPQKKHFVATCWEENVEPESILNDAGHGWPDPAVHETSHGSTETIGERIGAHLQMQRNAPFAQLQNVADFLQSQVGITQE